MKRLFVVCMLPLAACVNTNSPEFAKKSEKTCLSYGFKPGSEQMANCRMNLALIQEQDNMRRKQNMARAMSEFGDDMQRQSSANANALANIQYSTMPSLPQNRTVNCTSRRGLGTIETTCR